MKRATAVFILLFALLGLSGFASAGGGCCAIPVSTSSTRATAEKSVTLHIDGMTCGSCATAVRQVLKNVAGVKTAQVSLAGKKGVVTYDPTKVTPEKIANAVAQKLPTYKATIIK